VHNPGVSDTSAGTDYRADLDGLRAVAVLAVVGYHAAPAWLPGGFVGVDVFFVVSGFLITRILLDPRLTLREFFARRVRRIFPALLCVLAASLLAGWWLLLPHELAQLLREAAGAAGFGLNFVLWREAGYFDAGADQKPLLHLWSLSVEEQFYLLWPFALAWLALARRPRVVLAAAVVSFALGLAWIVRDAAGAFFLLPSRFWELLAGAWLALRADRRAGAASKAEWPAPVASALSIAGLALIVTACVALDRERRYPGAAALLPVMGTVCIIAAGRGAPVNRALSLRTLVAIGLVSYPLYLWHWPLLSFLRIVDGIEPAAWRKAAALAVAAILAVATYHLVERPIRYGHRVGVPSLLGAMAVAFLAASIGVVAHLAPRLSDPLLLRYDAAAHDWAFPGRFAQAGVPGGLRVFRAGAGSAPTVLFIGDSNVQQYGPRLEHLLDTGSASVGVEIATTGNCPPLPGVAARAGCAAFVDRALARARDASVARVVFAAQWGGYVDPATLVFARADGASLKGEPALAAAAEAFAATVRDLRSRGKDVYVVLNIPAAQVLDPRYLLRRDLDGGYALRTQGLPRAAWDAGARGVAILGAAARRAGAVVIDPVPALCSPLTCPAVDAQGEPLYRDGYHLRASFARAHADWIDATLLDPVAR